jgi:hypothetical protein
VRTACSSPGYSLADRVAEHVRAGDDLRERRVGERLALVEAVMAGGSSP